MYRAPWVIRCSSPSFQVSRTAAQYRELRRQPPQRAGHAISLNKSFIPGLAESNMNG